MRIFNPSNILKIIDIIKTIITENNSKIETTYFTLIILRKFNSGTAFSGNAKITEN